MLTKTFVAFTLITAAFTTTLLGEETLAIIKPDAVKAHHIGAILDKYEQSSLKIIGLKMVKLTPEQAGQFYAIHKDRPFYADLVKFFSSGPIVAIVLEGDDAVQKNRKIMGATNPAQADEGTIRRLFATSVTENAVHGSDSPASAAEEISFFFKPTEIFK